MNSPAKLLKRPSWPIWVTTAAILALAALLRLWALGRPDSLVFDELYYVRDAVSQLAHGFPTVWPDSDPAFGGERARSFTDQASSVAHPPLGKWLIGIGLLALGPDSGWGWRIAVAFAGVATVGATMRLGFVLSGNKWVAWFAGFFLAVDGVHVVLSRVALLDGFLAFFIVLGALFIAEDWRHSRAAGWPIWRRPWLIAAGVSFGAATAVKWSGLYAFAAFLLMLTVGGVVRTVSERRRPWFVATLRELAAATLALVVAFVTYLASWAGWILAPAAQNRRDGEQWPISLWRWHVDAFEWHSTLSDPHPFQSDPIGWPVGWRPTAMFGDKLGEQIAVISPIPNPLVTWAGVAALLMLAWVIGRATWQAVRSRRFAALRSSTVAISVFVLTGYLSGWLPWLFTVSRSAVFQFYAVVLTPFAALALAVVLAAFVAVPRNSKLFECIGIKLSNTPEAVKGRRIAVAIFVTAALGLAVLFWPLWAAMPINQEFYQGHLWLSGWS